MHAIEYDAVVKLNVGGVRFTTSRHTLTWIPDSFFTSLISGRIPSLQDEDGAIFIDRDPDMFKIILQYLRSRQVDLRGVDVRTLKHEAQFYGLSPLVKRLTLCEELDQSYCGDVLFHGYLPAPAIPIASSSTNTSCSESRSTSTLSRSPPNSTDFAGGDASFIGGNASNSPPRCPGWNLDTGQMDWCHSGASQSTSRHCQADAKARDSVSSVEKVSVGGITYNAGRLNNHDGSYELNQNNNSLEHRFEDIDAEGFQPGCTIHGCLCHLHNQQPQQTAHNRANGRPFAFQTHSRNRSEPPILPSFTGQWKNLPAGTATNIPPGLPVPPKRGADGDHSPIAGGSETTEKPGSGPMKPSSAVIYTSSNQETRIKLGDSCDDVEQMTPHSNHRTEESQTSTLTKSSVLIPPKTSTLNTDASMDPKGNQARTNADKNNKNGNGKNGTPVDAKGGQKQPTANPTSSIPVKKLGHTRASSADFRHGIPGSCGFGHYAGAVAAKLQLQRNNARSANVAELTRQIRQDLNHKPPGQDAYMDPHRVLMIRGHHNWVAVGYHNFICCYRMKDSMGWQLAYISSRTERPVRHIALNAKFGNASEKMLAAALANHEIHLWAIAEDGGEAKIGSFNLSVSIDTLFFIGSQLVALSQTGKVGIWHAMTQNWQSQDVVPISSYDTAGSFLLLGCVNGSIYYIDMQKFPLRMKDNDLLVTKLYTDPSNDIITAISVYLTPKTSLCGNWIEIAYGTSSGAVRVIVQHPETVGHGPQLFQTYTVHRTPITKVALTTNNLISVCSEYNHVRSWQVTRFRGMISTQPGSTPLASFKVMTLESADGAGPLESDANDVGPFGEQDAEQIFIQRIVPDTTQMFVRMASTGERICEIRSVDGSTISSFLIHEFDGSNRMGRPRRYLFTGHSNGSIQMWDLTTALDNYEKRDKSVKPASMNSGAYNSTTSCSQSGPDAEELMRLLDSCDLTTGCSRLASPTATPMGSVLHLPTAGIRREYGANFS